MSAPYNLSDSTLEIANRIFEILDDAKAELGLADVWFGDTTPPRVPALCVEPGNKRRQLRGVPDMTEMVIDTGLLIYYARVDQSDQQARRACIAFGERVENYLNVNHLRLISKDGSRQLTIHGFCTDFDPGYAYKPNTRYHAINMVWSSLTKTSLQRLA